MITVKQLKIYSKYDGDGDMLIRAGLKKEKQLIGYEDWQLIEELIQSLILVKNGLASQKFKDDLEERIKKNCENEKVVEELKKMAEVE